METVEALGNLRASYLSYTHKMVETSYNFDYNFLSMKLEPLKLQRVSLDYLK